MQNDTDDFSLLIGQDIGTYYDLERRHERAERQQRKRAYSRIGWTLLSVAGLILWLWAMSR